MKNLSLALLISIAAHLCLWRIASQWQAPKPPPAQRNIVLSLRAPPPQAAVFAPPPKTNEGKRQPHPPSTRLPPPRRAAAQPTEPQARRQRPVLKQAPDATATAHPSAAPAAFKAPNAAAQSPGQIDIYAGAWRPHGPGAASDTAEDPNVGATANDTAQMRLQGWTQAVRNRGHATAPLPKEIMQLRTNMVGAFSPQPADLRLAPNRHRRHKPVDPDILWRIERARQAMAPPPEARKHVELELATVVTLDHDAQGHAIRPRLLVPSGVDAFDKHVLHAVAEAVENAQWRGPPGVQHTWWEFTGKLLRWSRANLLLEPDFQLPGREIEDEKTLRYRTTVVGEVHLLEMAVGPHSEARVR